MHQLRSQGCIRSSSWRVSVDFRLGAREQAQLSRTVLTIIHVQKDYQDNHAELTSLTSSELQNHKALNAKRNSLWHLCLAFCQFCLKQMDISQRSNAPSIIQAIQPQTRSSAKPAIPCRVHVAKPNYRCTHVAQLAWQVASRLRLCAHHLQHHVLPSPRDPGASTFGDSPRSLTS